MVTKKKRTKNPIKRDHEVIVVKVAPDKTYASTLREVKHGLVMAGIKEEITQTRKT